MSYDCPECGGEVFITLTGYYCRDCDASWGFIAPENREGLFG